MSDNNSASSGLLGDPGFPQARRLAGRVAIVTGAGSRPAQVAEPIVGNGKATAIQFARAGARVALLDQRPAWMEETRQIITREGGECCLVEVDVADEASCRRAVAQVEQTLGAVEILVNNVGITGPAGDAVEVGADDWDRAMRVNLTSMMLMAKHVLPSMLAAGRGSIVNISSVAGLFGGHPNLFYPTSKAAIVGLTRSMAAHYGGRGIRVNCIAPGLLYTPHVAGSTMTPEMRDKRRQRSLLQTEGTGWDVALAALFLASDEARWITGVVLPVDAGATAGRSEALSPRSSESWE